MDNLEIQLAREPEQPEIEACVRAAYSAYIARLAKEPAPMHADYRTLIAQGVVYGLVDCTEIRGVLVLRSRDDHLCVENVAVDPRSQGHELGSQLMRFVEQHALA
jgi:predicted N-acetyltransferase YhbS